MARSRGIERNATIIGKQDENPLCALTLYDAFAVYALPLAYLGWTRSENILYALAFAGR